MIMGRSELEGPVSDIGRVELPWTNWGTATVLGYSLSSRGMETSVLETQHSVGSDPLWILAGSHLVCCPHSITAINCYTVSGGWKFLSPEDFSGFWIYLWYSTHVMNYLLSSVGWQVIDNVKVEPSKGHGPHQLIVAELQVSVIRPRCHNKVVSLSHRWGPASHIQCSAFLIKLHFFLNSLGEGSVPGVSMSNLLPMAMQAMPHRALGTPFAS